MGSWPSAARQTDDGHIEPVDESLTPMVPVLERNNNNDPWSTIEKKPDAQWIKIKLESHDVLTDLRENIEYKFEEDGKGTPQDALNNIAKLRDFVNLFNLNPNAQLSSIEIIKYINDRYEAEPTPVKIDLPAGPTISRYKPNKQVLLALDSELSHVVKGLHEKNTKSLAKIYFGAEIIDPLFFDVLNTLLTAMNVHKVILAGNKTSRSTCETMFAVHDRYVIHPLTRHHHAQPLSAMKFNE